MKVLMFNQFFPPDGAPTGEQLAEVAEALLAEGAEVTVVCSRSRYVESEGRPAPPVEVVRVPGPRFGRKTLVRLFSYGTYLFFALWRGLRCSDADVVVTMSTPPLLCAVGLAAQVLHRRKHVMWEMDLYPDVAIALGVLRPTAPWTRALGALADLARRRADAIIVPGECMRRRLIERGIEAERVRTAENWVDRASVHPPNGMPVGPLHVLYAGNLGLSHDVGTICQVLEATRDVGTCRFTFSGGGARRPELEEFCRRRNFQHVSFGPYHSRAEQDELLASAHLGLVTQHGATAGMLVPSKIYRLMAASRPVLFIGPQASQAAWTIARHRCGWQFECGDWRGVVDLLRDLESDRGAIFETGRRGREAFVRAYDLSSGTARIIEILHGVAAGKLSAVKEVSQCL